METFLRARWSLAARSPFGFAPLLVRPLATKRSSGKRQDQSRELVQQLKSAKHPNEVSSLLNGHPEPINQFVLSAAMGQLRRFRKPSEALSLFERSRAQGLVQTVFTFSAAISAAERLRDWQMALSLLVQMQDAGIEPNDVSYSTTISACEKGRQWEKALELFGQMQQRGLDPDVIAYNATISACETARRFEEARAVFLKAHLDFCFPKILPLGGKLELRELSAPMARTTVRMALEDLRHEPEHRQFYKSALEGDFGIVTGQGGLRGSGKSVLQPAIVALFEDEYKELHCEQHSQNHGLLIISERSLRVWMESE